MAAGTAPTGRKPLSGAHWDGLEGSFRAPVAQLIAASGGRVWLVSGHRSPERQKQLWAAALKKYGDPEVADNWVARPGTSNHEKGRAVDLGGDLALAARLAAQFGLKRPMPHEPWHFEPDGDPELDDSYATAKLGREENRNDLGVQLDDFAAIVGGTVAELGQPTQLTGLSFAPEPTPTPGTIVNEDHVDTDAQEEIDRFMSALRRRESGGNYRAYGPQTKYGQATGAYQFLDDTWGNYKGYRRAADAPAAIQDERARQLMLAAYAKYGDWRTVAMYWHGGPNQQLWGPKTRAYAEDVVKGMAA